MKNYLFILVCLVSNVILAQSNYFVAISGSNANDGSISSPWETIQYSCNQLLPGDTLNIKEGVYEEKIYINVSGTSSAYITIRNYESDIATIDAISFDDYYAILYTDNAYLRIVGLNITNNIFNGASGIAIQGAAHHIEIINNKVSNIKFSADPDAEVLPSTNAVPIDIWADLPLDSIHTILIKGNEVFNNQTGYSENIAAGGNFSNFIIEENYVHHNTNIGIDIGGNYEISPNPLLDQGRNGVIRNNIVSFCDAPYGTAAGIYIDGGKNIIVENNICHNNGYGGEIGCEENGSTSNITFKNNIFYNNIYAGMHIGGYDVGTTGIVLNSKVFNNTFYNNDTGNNNHGELLLSKSENCNIENNVFYISEQNVYIKAYRTQTDFVLNYNLVYTTAGSASIKTVGNFETTGLDNFYLISGYGANSTFGNPLFVNALSADFHISSEYSPAINAGNPLYSAAIDEVDMDGQIRIHEDRVDCGADEYASGFAFAKEFNVSKAITYPNPTNGILYIENLSVYSYQIFAMDGKLIKEDENSIATYIDLSELKNGMYYIQLREKEEKYTFKIVKKD